MSCDPEPVVFTGPVTMCSPREPPCVRVANVSQRLPGPGSPLLSLRLASAVPVVCDRWRIPGWQIAW